MTKIGILNEQEQVLHNRYFSEDLKKGKILGCQFNCHAMNGVE